MINIQNLKTKISVVFMGHLRLDYVVTVWVDIPRLSENQWTVLRGSMSLSHSTDCSEVLLVAIVSGSDTRFKSFPYEDNIIAISICCAIFSS